MTTELPPECIEDLKRRNAVITQANARIAQLGSSCVRAREMAQGVELTIERPSWKKGHVARSYEIIPWTP